MSIREDLNKARELDDARDAVSTRSFKGSSNNGSLDLTSNLASSNRKSQAAQIKVTMSERQQERLEERADLRADDQRKATMVEKSLVDFTISSSDIAKAKFSQISEREKREERADLRDISVSSIADIEVLEPVELKSRQAVEAGSGDVSDRGISEDRDTDASERPTSTIISTPSDSPVSTPTDLGSSGPEPDIYFLGRLLTKSELAGQVELGNITESQAAQAVIAEAARVENDSNVRDVLRAELRVLQATTEQERQQALMAERSARLTLSNSGFEPVSTSAAFALAEKADSDLSRDVLDSFNSREITEEQAVAYYSNIVKAPEYDPTFNEYQNAILSSTGLTETKAIQERYSTTVDALEASLFEGFYNLTESIIEGLDPEDLVFVGIDTGVVEAAAIQADIVSRIPEGMEGNVVLAVDEGLITKEEAYSLGYDKDNLEVALVSLNTPDEAEEQYRLLESAGFVTDGKIDSIGAIQGGMANALAKVTGDKKGVEAMSRLAATAEGGRVNFAKLSREDLDTLDVGSSRYRDSLDNLRSYIKADGTTDITRYIEDNYDTETNQLSSEGYNTLLGFGVEVGGAQGVGQYLEGLKIKARYKDFSAEMEAIGVLENGSISFERAEAAGIAQSDLVAGFNLDSETVRAGYAEVAEFRLQEQLVEDAEEQDRLAEPIRHVLDSSYRTAAGYNITQALADKAITPDGLRLANFQDADITSAVKQAEGAYLKDFTFTNSMTALKADGYADDKGIYAGRFLKAGGNSQVLLDVGLTQEDIDKVRPYEGPRVTTAAFDTIHEDLEGWARTVGRLHTGPRAATSTFDMAKVRAAGEVYKIKEMVLSGEISPQRGEELAKEIDKNPTKADKIVSSELGAIQVMFMPFIPTALTWKNDSWKMRSVNLFIDAVTVATMGMTAISTARAVNAAKGIHRMTAIAKTVAMDEILAPVALVSAPISVVKAAARLAYEPFEVAFSLRRLTGVEQSRTSLKISTVGVGDRLNPSLLGSTKSLDESLTAGITTPQEVKAAGTTSVLGATVGGKTTTTYIPGSKTGIKILKNVMPEAGGWSATTDLRSIKAGTITVAGKEGGIYFGTSFFSRFADVTSGGGGGAVTVKDIAKAKKASDKAAKILAKADPEDVSKATATVEEVASSGEKVKELETTLRNVIASNESTPDLIKVASTDFTAAQLEHKKLFDAIPKKIFKLARLQEIQKNHLSMVEAQTAAYGFLTDEAKVLVDSGQMLNQPMAGGYYVKDPEVLAAMRPAAMPAGGGAGILPETPGSELKIYRDSAELEMVLPNDFILPKASQILYFKGENGKRYAIAIIGKPLTKFQILKMKIRGPIAALKNVLAPGSSLIGDSGDLVTDLLKQADSLQADGLSDAAATLRSKADVIKNILPADDGFSRVSRILSDVGRIDSADAERLASGTGARLGRGLSRVPADAGRLDTPRIEDERLTRISSDIRRLPAIASRGDRLSEGRDADRASIRSQIDLPRFSGRVDSPARADTPRPDGRVDQTRIPDVRSPYVRSPDIRFPDTRIDPPRPFEPRIDPVRPPEPRSEIVRPPDVRPPGVRSPDVRAPDVRPSDPIRIDPPRLEPPRVEPPQAESLRVRLPRPDRDDKDVRDGGGLVLSAEVHPRDAGSVKPVYTVVAAGSMQRVRPTARVGWKFDHWEGDVPLGKERQQILEVEVSSDTSLIAIFVPDEGQALKRLRSKLPKYIIPISPIHRGRNIPGVSRLIRSRQERF